MISSLYTCGEPDGLKVRVQCFKCGGDIWQNNYEETLPCPHCGHKDGAWIPPKYREVGWWEPKTCEHCRFFIEEAGDHYSDGACNRNAPVMTTSGFTKRPNVHKGHWCGDWEKTDEGINVK